MDATETTSEVEEENTAGCSLEAFVNEDKVSIGQRLGNTAELPPELRSQLPGFKTSKEDDAVREALNSHLGGSGSIDEILVSLWRLDASTRDRKKLAVRLANMVKKGKLAKVAGRRGCYATEEA